MRRPEPEALERWLAAERDDRDDGDGAAEGALRELFAALPLAAPPAGFADRVMARVSLPRMAPAALPANRRDVFAWRPLRVVLTLCLVATGLGSLWLPPLLRALSELWSFGGLLAGGTRLLIDAAGWLATLLRAWDFLLTLERALVQPLAAPQVTALLLGGLLASSLAFRFLRDQITGERWTHVDPI